VAFIIERMSDEKSFSDTLVGDVYTLIVKEPAQVQKSAKIREAIELMLNNPISRKVYVVDVEGNLVGAVTIETVLRLVGYRVGVKQDRGLELFRFLRDTLKEDVEQVIAKVKPVKKETKLTEALQIMIDNHLNDLPVVDDDYKLIGELSSVELLEKGRQLFEE
jgi:CBS domain-containing protein